MHYFSRVFSVQTTGLSGQILTIETDITKGSLYAFAIVGLPDKAVEEARDRVSAAIKNSGLPSPKSTNQKIVVSLAPADLKKEGSFFDLPMALSYLLAAKEIDFDPAGKIFLGELALDGSVRPVRGALVLTTEAKRKGFSEIYVPAENAREAALVSDISVFPVSHLRDVLSHLDPERAKKEARTEATPKPLHAMPHTTPPKPTYAAHHDFSDIRGQEGAKRGLVIAAAGRHNIAMFGPPGTGKTMLARAFGSILPSLSFDEALEVTGIHSVAGVLRDDLLTVPPFRAPHHTSSYTSIVGGGTIPKPGEITLAHKGVLFLDEFPEFETRVLESLRQPLEDNVVSIARVKGTEIFPANVTLIAAMNPCPCGNLGSDTPCTCTHSARAKYDRRLSGPIMDRIDMWVEVARVPHEKLSHGNTGEKSDILREQVAHARAHQEKRFAKHPHIATNGDMSARDIEALVPLSASVQTLLTKSAQSLNLSARAYHKTIKIARTIADLADATAIEESHMLEALSYRPKERG